MSVNRSIGLWILGMGLLVSLTLSCKKDTPNPVTPPVDPDTTGTFDPSSITDTYPQVASIDQIYHWGPYNVHDPSILRVGNYYYCYSTDAAYGTEVKPGIQVRQSPDLVQWSFMGWVFDDLPEKGSNFIQSMGGTPLQGLWAPYIMEVNGIYRLYYSLASDKARLSVIGLATASSPLGPWTEVDVVVNSMNNADVHTNAIDPTVLIDKEGRHWMYYGSSWDGIWIVELDPSTGLTLQSGDKGVRIAHRGFTGGVINGNIEGSEIIYQPEQDMYYLFISYDWLATKYNVRVGRSVNPQGPFTDYTGADMNQYSDNTPMIIAPYKFDGHGGWQGVAHPSVFKDANGDFYIAHQGRPGVDPYYMVLHVQQLFWTPDGWPVVSPERVAGVEQVPVLNDELIGEYERIEMGYHVVPGFDDTQVSPDFQTSELFTLSADGTFNGQSCCTWSYDDPWLTLDWSSGLIEVVHAGHGRDWENSLASTVLLTGLNNRGTAVWYKKKN